MSELDDLLAMLGPLPELPVLWTGWAEYVAQVEEVVASYQSS